MTSVFSSATLVDQWMPDFDVSARHTIHVAASPEQTYEVARNAPPEGPRLVRLLMALRIVPALVARALGRDTPAPEPKDGVMLRAGVPFTLLAESDGSEFVLGLAGQFWKPAGGIVVVEREAFRTPPPAGLAHAVWNFRVEPHAGGCRLITETRVLCADAATRRAFLRYWRVVSFGSGLIRMSMLRDIRRRAERRRADA